MPPLSYIVIAFIVPAVVVAVAAFLRWRWIFALAFPAAFAVAQWEIHGLPPGAPGSGDAGFWIFWFTIPLAVLGLLDAVFRPSLALRAAIGFVGAVIAFHLLLSNLSVAAPKAVWIQRSWVWGLAAAATVLWAGLESLAERNAGVTVPAILAVQCLGGAALLGTENSVVASHGAVALAAMACAAVAVSLVRRNITYSRGPVLTLSFSLVALLACAYFYAYPDLPGTSVAYGAVLIFSPLLAWCGEIRGIRRRGPLLRFFVRILPVLLVVGTVAAVAVHEYVAGQTNGAGPGGGEEE